MKARHLFFFVFLVMLGLGAFAPSVSLAAGYPDHPIQLIIPYVAGATGDITARMLAEEMEKATGAKIIPNNKPGAGTVLVPTLPPGRKRMDTLFSTVALRP